MALVNITPYRYGGYLVRFVSNRLHRRAVNGMVTLTDREREAVLKDGILLQSEEALVDLSPRHIRELEKGYDVNVQMDPWVAAHYYGYDAHTAFE